MIDARFDAPGRVELRHSVPQEPVAPGQVLVEVGCVSLCGSDYQLYDGSYAGPRRYPIRFGHEWAGRVVATSGERFAVGAHVTGDCSRWCGVCDMCSRDRNLCRSIEKFGITCDGFSTTYCLVDERYLYDDPYDLDDTALALTELFAVAMRGVDRAGRAIVGAPVLVIGAGPLGLAVHAIARARGAHVQLAEASPQRMACADRRFPGLRWFTADAEPLDSYRSIAEAARFPVVFECAGTTRALEAALAAVALRGTVVAFGLGTTGELRTSLVVTKAVTLRGSIGGTGSFERALEFLATHRDLARAMVTHRVPAQRAQEAFRAPAERASQLKVQLVFQG